MAVVAVGVADVEWEPAPPRVGRFRPRARILDPPLGADPRQRVEALTDAHTSRTPPQRLAMDPDAAADMILDRLERGDSYPADMDTDTAAANDLVRRSWTEVRSGLTLLVPLGSTEQHGPHLPLDTDTVIATEIATRAAATRGGRVLVAPRSLMGAGEHAGFPGTLSIGTAALKSVLVELGRPATKPNGGPFARLVFINGHGGNHSALTDALEILRSEGRDVAAWWPTIPHGDAHAGHPETSLLLAIAPHLVGVERDHGSGGSSGEHRGAVVSVGRNTARRGALGEPDGNPRRCHRSQRHRAGERILSALVEQLISFLETSAA